MPVFHALKLLVNEICAKEYKKPLLLASAFSLKDGFIQKKLSQHSRQLDVIIPNDSEIEEINLAHHTIINNNEKESPQNTFDKIIKKYEVEADVIISACTEYGPFIKASAKLPIIVQCQSAVEYALNS